MRENFDAALSAVLVHEGGWSNHPKDPGGATMKGVIQRVYDAYRARNGLWKQSVRHISDAELRAIYRRQYWDLVRGDSLPAGLDYAVFDYAVNSGPSRAIKHLQKALGVKQDGALGIVTMKAAEDAGAAAISRLLDIRLAFLRALKTWPTFGKGWKRRVDGVRELAMKMAG